MKRKKKQKKTPCRIDNACNRKGKGKKQQLDMSEVRAQIRELVKNSSLNATEDANEGFQQIYDAIFSDKK